MIHVGDCLAILPTLEAESVQCCVTSPPYFGLRDYGVAGQHGSEETPEAFVANLVAVFREVRRVLKDDGTLWLNLGDSYAGSGRGGNPTEATSGLQGGQASQRESMVKRTRDDVSAAQRQRCPATVGSRLPAGLHETQRQAGAIGRAWVPPPAGFKNKDLMGIPWMVAFALRADGWYLRQEIIWHKPNPMPESVTDRCTKAHEHIFLLAKSPRYYFDAEAISEEVAESTVARLAQCVEEQTGSDRVPGKTNGNMKAKPPRFGGEKYGDSDDPKHQTKSGNAYTFARKTATEGPPGQPAQHREGREPVEYRGRRNKRSVWTVATQPFKEAHFATFPPALIEPCILAGSRTGDLVLDPYMGAGTTAVVCERLARNWVGIELNPDYAAIAERRIKAVQPGLSFANA